MTLTSAYGRVYNNMADAVADWNAGKDFRLHDLRHGGTYCSRRDMEGKHKHLELRYGKRNEKVCVIYHKGDKWETKP